LRDDFTAHSLIGDIRWVADIEGDGHDYDIRSSAARHMDRVQAVTRWQVCCSTH